MFGGSEEISLPALPNADHGGLFIGGASGTVLVFRGIRLPDVVPRQCAMGRNESIGQAPT